MENAIRYDGKKGFTEKMILESLGKPGDGIPAPAKLILKYVLKPFKIRPFKWSECSEQLQKANALFFKELSLLNEEDFTKKVLVPTIVGIEDSSRYWSAAMVCRHLTIVSSAMESIILTLLKGESFPIVADTARVKPEMEKNDLASIEEYKKLTQSISKNIEEGLRKLEKPDFKITHRHPWFGDMQAKDWYWLIGTHVFIHLKQLKEIRKGLEKR